MVGRSSVARAAPAMSRVDGGQGDPPPRPEWHSHGAVACPDAPAGVTVERSVSGEYWVSRCSCGWQVPWWPADRRVPFGGVPSPFAARPARAVA